MFEKKREGVYHLRLDKPVTGVDFLAAIQKAKENPRKEAAVSFACLNMGRSDWGDGPDIRKPGAFTHCKDGTDPEYPLRPWALFGSVYLQFTYNGDPDDPKKSRGSEFTLSGQVVTSALVKEIHRELSGN